MVIFLSIVVLLGLSIGIFVRLPQFGKLPSGERLERIKKSPHYKEGQFQNMHFTPNLVEGVSIATVMKQFLFGKNKNRTPPGVVPARKTDLLNLVPSKNCLVWFGHSSYFIQIDGKKILVDPVFSGNASPLPSTTKSFPGSDVYTADDLPEIDYLFITHDHWDHLDYKTVVKLRSKVKQVITSLGTGAHLERWNYDKKKIVEKDWDQEVMLDNGFVINTTSARDSGYDTHFAEIGNKYGPFDLVILECGQYSPYWKYIHMMPEETVQAGLDLKANKILPVHWAKFSLSLNDWDDSIKRVTAEASKKNMPLVHPMIGEEVDLNGPMKFSRWWENIN